MELHRPKEHGYVNCLENYFKVECGVQSLGQLSPEQRRLESAE
jgi:hypothetical protein